MLASNQAARYFAWTMPGLAWLDSWRSAHAIGWDCLETMWGLRPPQRLRDRLLAEVRQAVAGQLRSPAFLEFMRWNLGAMTVSTRLTTPFQIH
jgi:hypothetical protein